jgi:serine/threonine protein kinase
MALAPGTRLGPYELVGALGAGGMGQVYRARDIRLDRSVAIKVLPEDLAGDPARRARFEREVAVLSWNRHAHDERRDSRRERRRGGAAQSLFQARIPLVASNRTNYVVSRDGQRFLINTAVGEGLSTPLSIVLNWPALLER